MKLFYREYGKGEPIIIAHGLFGMSDNWIPVAKKLSANFKVYLLDMRNHGKSPHSPFHTYDAMSDDLFEFIEDKNIENANFIGHSMGGKTVLRFSEKHPEKVKKMLIIDISPAEYIPSEDFFKKALNHKLLLEDLLTIDLQNIKSSNELIKFITDKFRNPFFIQLILKNIIKNKNGFEHKINLKALYENLEEMRREIKLTEKVKDIKSLFLFGGNSPYLREQDKDYIQKHLHEAKIKIIAGAGHLPHTEKETETAESIKYFLIS